MGKLRHPNIVERATTFTRQGMDLQTLDSARAAQTEHHPAMTCAPSSFGLGYPSRVAGRAGPWDWFQESGGYVVYRPTV